MNDLLEQDRLALRERPSHRQAMWQEWQKLLFLHWEVPVEVLRPLIPSALDLDLFEGKAYIGLVPFTMKGVRPIGFPHIPALCDFHETNVRTYVHLQGRNPGVWFFSLDAANRLAVLVARHWFKLPYFHAQMEMSQKQNQITYSTTRAKSENRPAHLKTHYEIEEGVFFANPGTLEFFLAERYLLYAMQGSTLYAGQVYHTPYPLQRAKIVTLEESMIQATGMKHGEEMPLAHYSEGVKVRVYGLQKVKGEIK
jgi:uncharacterized protein YqjF (DUF2071 family)